jgi:hypothetical protein
MSRALPALLCAACGATPSVLSTPVVRGQAATATAQAERLWSERLDRDHLRAAIAEWQRAVAAADDDAASRAQLAQADYFLADGFLAGAEAKATFEAGAAAAERGLRARAPAFEQRRQGGAAVDEAAADLGVECVPLLYWWGQNVIRWADLAGRMTAARTYKGVRRVMEQVARLDPSYDHGGAERWLGSFYAEAPGIAGGDLDASRGHFARAFAIDGDYLGNLLDRAQHWARRAGDAAAYRADLERVRAAAARSPEEEIAKRKALKLPAEL